MKGELGLLMLGVGIAAVVGEVALRLFPIAAVEVHRHGRAGADVPLFSYDASLGWRGRPQARGVFSGWEFTTMVQNNRAGFRDREWPEQKAPGAVRIVVFGDSITWGYGAGQTERYSDLLRELLRRKGLPIEVVNLAVSGYGTDQEYLLFQAEGRRYCPDLVLLGLYENDLRENAAAYQGRHPKPYFRAVPGKEELVLENVPVPRVADTAENEPAGGPQSGPSRVKAVLRQHVRLYALAAFLKETIRQRLADDPKPASIPPDGETLTARLLGRFAQAAAHTGSGFAVIVLPDVWFTPAMAGAVTHSGIRTFFDLSPVFQKAAADGERLFYKLDGAHWTPRAHAIAAEAIAQFVMRARLLPDRPRTCAQPGK